MSDAPNQESPGSATPGSTIKVVQRDARGRIKKGSSGNPRGRPLKEVRAFTKQALTRDFIAEIERTVVVNGEKMTVIHFMLRQLTLGAMKGDSQARKEFWRQYDNAIEVVEETNQELFKILKSFEQFVLDRGLTMDPATLKQLYEVRRRAKAI